MPASREPPALQAAAARFPVGWSVYNLDQGDTGSSPAPVKPEFRLWLNEFNPHVVRSDDDRHLDVLARLKWYQDTFGGEMARLNEQLGGLRYGTVWLFIDRHTEGARLGLHLQMGRGTLRSSRV